MFMFAKSKIERLPIARAAAEVEQLAEVVPVGHDIKRAHVEARCADVDRVEQRLEGARRRGHFVLGTKCVVGLFAHSKLSGTRRDERGGCTRNYDSAVFTCRAGAPVVRGDRFEPSWEHAPLSIHLVYTQKEFSNILMTTEPPADLRGVVTEVVLPHHALFRNDANRIGAREQEFFSVVIVR